MISTLDIIVIGIYLIIILFISIKSSLGQRLEDYLVNRRKTSLFVLTTSNVSTLLGAGTIIAPASAAYVTGISFGITMFFPVIFATILLAIAAPKIKRFGDNYNAFTLGDFLAYRYGKRTRMIASIFIVLLLFVLTAVQFASISILLKVLFDINYIYAIIGTTIITILYTSIGGIKSDILTDFWQFWVMLISFIILMPIVWIKGGGLITLSALSSSYFNPTAFGGFGFLIGGTLLASLITLPNTNYWMRIYSADSVETSKKSFWYSIPFVALFIIFAILIGLFAVSALPGINADLTLFEMMNKFLPTGFRGLAFAGILAIGMSTIDSMLLGGSATIFEDLLNPIFNLRNKNKSIKTIRYITFVFGICCAVLALLVPSILDLSMLLLSVAACFAPIIVCGLFWKKATATAAISSLLSSLITLFIFVLINPKIAFIPSFIMAFLSIIIISLIEIKSKRSTNQGINIL